MYTIDLLVGFGCEHEPGEEDDAGCRRQSVRWEPATLPGGTGCATLSPKQQPDLIAMIKTIFARKPPKPFTSGESSLPMCWRRKSPKLADMMMDARGCASLHAFP